MKGLVLGMVLRLVVVGALAGCGGQSYTADDATRNTVAAQIEARQLERCAVADAGTCTPAFMRVTAATAFCANAGALAAHGAAVPEAGTDCPKAAP